MTTLRNCFPGCRPRTFVTGSSLARAKSPTVTQLGRRDPIQSKTLIRRQEPFRPKKSGRATPIGLRRLKSRRRQWRHATSRLLQPRLPLSRPPRLHLPPQGRSLRPQQSRMSLRSDRSTRSSTGFLVDRPAPAIPVTASGAFRGWAQPTAARVKMAPYPVGPWGSGLQASGVAAHASALRNGFRRGLKPMMVS